MVKLKPKKSVLFASNVLGVRLNHRPSRTGEIKVTLCTAYAAPLHHNLKLN